MNSYTKYRPAGFLTRTGRKSAIKSWLSVEVDGVPRLHYIVVGLAVGIGGWFILEWVMIVGALAGGR